MESLDLPAVEAALKTTLEEIGERENSTASSRLLRRNIHL